MEEKTLNYYQSKLPQFNPAAVLVFDVNGNMIFANVPAKEYFSHINHIGDFNYTEYSDIILENKTVSILFEKLEKTFEITFVGSNDDKCIYTYINNVTKIIELNDEIEYTQKEVIYAMGAIGESRSKETGNHVKRVAHYSKILAIKYGLSLHDAELLKTASPMHDIGKVGIPDNILNKPGKLTPEEFQIMKTHAQIGHDLLKDYNKPIFNAASIIAGEHHEKWDGSGYPNALKGENIHIFARITAVADVFDALGSDRVYKKAWPLDKILDLFQKEKAKHFDPTLIDLFVNDLDDFLKVRDKFVD